jgi:hypothetical protein
MARRSRTHARPQVVARSLPTGRDEVVVSSVLPGVLPEDAWFHASTAQGINQELYPLLRMKMPKGASWHRLTDVPVGVEAGRCPVLLAGVLPVDHDDLFLEEVGPGMRFRERSRTSTTRVWAHERMVDDVAGNARLQDRVVFEVQPRLRRMRGLHRQVVAFLFRHRHRRLRTVIAPRLATAETPEESA